MGGFWGGFIIGLIVYWGFQHFTGMGNTGRSAS